MKSFLTLSILILVNFSFGQITYESPYVLDGQSFKMTLPKQFQPVEAPEMGMSVYAIDAESSFISDQPSSDCIVIYLMPNEEGITIEEALNEAKTEMPNGMESIKKISTSKGYDFLFGTADLDLGIEGVTLSDFGMTLFEDIVVMVMYVDIDDNYTNSKMIHDIANSFTTYETSRENELVFEYDEYDYLGEYEDILGFQNSLYETRLSYEEVFFRTWNEEEDDTDWYEDFDEDFLELLTAYEFIDYDQENPLTQGGIKFFSGGFADNFKREIDQVEALQRVFPDYNISEIEFEKEVQGDEFKFKRYKITSLSKSNNAFAYYSTTYQGELLFFMVYDEWQPSDQFKSEYEDVIKSFFIVENE